MSCCKELFQVADLGCQEHGERSIVNEHLSRRRFPRDDDEFVVIPIACFSGSSHCSTEVALQVRQAIEDRCRVRVLRVSPTIGPALRRRLARRSFRARTSAALNVDRSFLLALRFTFLHVCRVRYAVGEPAAKSSGSLRW